MSNREAVVTEAAERGAEHAHKYFRTNLEVKTKSNKTDLVTEADKSTQRRIVSIIQERFPDEVIVGEENEQQKTIPQEGYSWVIDPIDGTQNYAHGMSEWVTSIALVESGSPIAAINAAPALGDQYAVTPSMVMRNGDSVTVSDKSDLETFRVASILRLHSHDSERFGQLAQLTNDYFGEFRRIGSTQLALSLVASGALDGAVSFTPEPNVWDTVAGVYQVRQAGGTVTDLSGDDWNPSRRGIVASNGNLHDDFLSTIRMAVE